jgi:hypothetical protein
MIKFFDDISTGFFEDDLPKTEFVLFLFYSKRSSFDHPEPIGFRNL